jgi:hypothetical protein
MLKKYLTDYPFYFVAFIFTGMASISYTALTLSGYSELWWPTGIFAVIGCFSLLLRSLFKGIGEGEGNHPIIAKHHTPPHDKNEIRG